MNNETYGVSIMLTNLISPVAHQMSLWGVILLGMVITLILTNFMSNLVTLAVVIPVFIPMIAEMGGSTITAGVYAAALLSMSGMAFLTPASQAQAPMFIGKHFSVKEAMVPNIIMCLVGFLLTVGSILL